MTQAQPFKIDIAQSVLDDLQTRLASTRWPDEIDGAGWAYGTNLTYLKALIAYWKDQYDWRTQEAMLNGFKQFRAEIDGFGVHFIHERGTGPNPMPIVLSHGWPDSFTRMLKLIPLLTDPASHGGDPADSFDVVVPSLPGYAFSDRPHTRGWTSYNTADLWAKLMTDVLGYPRFAAHGGDFGSAVTQRLAYKHPDVLFGIHLTDIGYRTLSDDQAKLTEAEQKYMQEGQQWGMAEGGYGMVQSTKPQTLAYELNDSPVGLAGWIVEKFNSWSDNGGNIENCFSKDELLNNIMLFWVTQSMASSIRFYYEDAKTPPPLKAGEHLDVPVAIANFPKDLVHPPREFAERSLRVERWTEMPRGGHFAALEEPELLADDIRAFFRQFRA